MAMPARAERQLSYIIVCNGERYIVFNTAGIGNPYNDPPGKWYFQRYPMPVGAPVGQYFDTAEEAEQAARGVDQAHVFPRVV